MEGEGGHQIMTSFHYVYVLQSLSHPKQLYTGSNANLKQRLIEHNSGRVAQGRKAKPTCPP